MKRSHTDAQLRPGVWGHMRVKALLVSFLLLSGASLWAESFTVAQWHSQIASGNEKAAAMGAWGKAPHYDTQQDANYRLLKKGAVLESTSEVPQGNSSLKLDLNRQLQPVWGLGATMTDSSAWILGELKKKDPSLYRWTMERLFSPEKGAGFSVIRLAVGASDYTAADDYYTYCDEESPDLSKFSIERERVHLLPVLKDALELNPRIRFMASPWSPPAWMKTNGSLTGISKQEKAQGKTNRLKPEHYETFARYLVKVVESYRDEGINIEALTLQNEPQFDRAAYPCMRLTKEDYIGVMKVLGPLLNERSMKTVVLLHDHNWILHANDRDPVGGDQKQDPFTLVSELYQHPGFGDLIAGSAWHIYAGNADDMARVYTSLAEQFPDKIFMTTEGTAWGSKRQKWDSGTRTDIEINWKPDVSWGTQHNWWGTFVHGGAAALQWNFALDHRHGPSPRNDSFGYGLVTVQTDSWKEVKLEREYYAMAHLSKLMAGGGRRIAAELLKKDGQPVMHCQVLAVERADGVVGVFFFNQHSERPLEVTTVYGNEQVILEVASDSLSTFLFSPLQK